MRDTRERSGASAARYAMPDAPLNDPAMERHSVSPHCSMAVSIAALFGSSSRCMCLKSPDMDTL